MKIQTDYSRLLDHGVKSLDGAVDDTLAEARANAERHSRTGEYAASLQRTNVEGEPGGRQNAVLGSHLPQAGAVERGADVGPRKGPHMKGIYAVRDAGDHFPEHMTRRLRETPI